ncbi:MAG TPA: tetratricopeptide repeat protein [Abditibacteriaceae bacterium]
MAHQPIERRLMPQSTSYCIWSRRKPQSKTALCVLLVVAGAASSIPVTEALAAPARSKTSVKNKKKRSAKSRRSKVVRAIRPQRRLTTRRMQVGGVLVDSGAHPSIPNVQSSAIPSTTNVLVQPVAPPIVLAQAPVESAPTGTTTPNAASSGAGSLAPTAPSPESVPSAPAPTEPIPITPVPVAPTPDSPTPIAPEATSPITPPITPVAPPDLSNPVTPLTGEEETVEEGADATGNQAEALRGLGEIRRRQQRYSEAVDFFRRAILLDPADIKARVGLSQSLRGLKNYEEALVESEKALALDPANLPARVIHVQLLSDNNRGEEADKELEALMGSLPEKPSPEIYAALGQAFTGLRNYPAALQILQRGQQDYPNDAFIARNVAETLTYAKRWDEAITAWDALIAADAKDADAVLGKARVYNYSAREDQAEPLYRRVLELEPENYQAQAELADVVGRRGNWPEAINLYRSALAKNQGDLPTRVELARVLRYTGRYAESEQELNQVLAIDARFAPALTERGILRGQNKRYDLAIADLEEALRLTPNDVNAQFGLAEVLSYNKRYDESIALYRKALDQEPDNQKGRVQLGLALSYASRGDEALKEFDTVLASNPANMSAQIGKADTLARMRRFPESIALYQAILQTDANNRRANAGLAEAYIYSKQYTQAITLYDRLVTAYPDDVNLAIDRGRAYGYAGLHSEAVKILRPIVAANAENIEARLFLAEALTNSGDRQAREEAVGHYRTLLTADPNNHDARYGLGRVLSYQGRTREAQAELRRVIAARPSDPDAYYALAETQRYSEPFEAKANYQKALQLGSQGYNASRATLALRQLRRETNPSLDLSYRRYSDTNGVRLTEYGGGPTIRTRAGTLGVYGRTGTYTDDNFWQTRQALSVLLAKRFGSVSARLLLHRVNYAVAPDRTLYNLSLNKSLGVRKRYWATLGRDEVIESLGATNAGITRQDYRIGADLPLARKIDLELEARYFRYSDGNNRITLRPSLYYRLQADAPTLRLGVGYVYDDTKFLSPIPTPYYAPQGYNTFALLADYVKTQGRTRYGVFAAHPLSDNTGIGGTNRPANTLFGFVQHDISDILQLFVEGGIVRGPNYDSNEITGGLSYWF